MPQAGSARVAYRVEDEFREAGTGDWKQPGTDIAVNTLEIDNDAERVRNPDNAIPVGSREGNALLNASVEFTLTDDDWAVDLLPLLGDSLDGRGRVVPTAEWFFEAEYLDDGLGIDDDHLTLAGAAIESVDVDYNDGEFVTVSLDIIGGGLSSSAPTEGEITQPDEEDVFTQHSLDLSIGGRDADVVESATLSITGLAERSEQTGDRLPRAMVLGPVEPEFDVEATYTGPDTLELATGDTTSSIGDLIDGEATAEYHFENGIGDSVEFDLTNVQPVNYDWSGLVDAETELTEPATFHVANVSVGGA